MLKCQLKDGYYLALIEKQHAAILFDLMERNRSHFQKYIGIINRINSLKDAEESIVNARKDGADGKLCGWGIWCNSKIVGNVNIHDIDNVTKSGDVGYYIDKEHEGKGLVRLAMEELIHYVFEEYGLERIVIECATMNERSRNIAEYLGFCHEGILRKKYVLNGNLEDCHIYSLLRSEAKLRYNIT